MKTIFALTALLITLHAFANEKGNGGDAIVCRNTEGTIVKAQLLDYYEGRVYRNIPHVFEKNLSHAEYINQLADRLEFFDSRRFANFRKESHLLLRSIENFLAGNAQAQRGYVFTDSALIDIPDSRHLQMPQGCEVEQLAIRMTPKFPEDPRFMIQGEILKELSADHVRGILLHEMFYMIFNHEFYDGKDSTNARYFHQRVTSVPLEDLTFLELVKILGEMYKGPTFLTRGDHEMSLAMKLESSDLMSSGATFGLNAGIFFYKLDGSFDLEETNVRGSISTHLYDPYVVGCWAQLQYSVTDSQGVSQDFSRQQLVKLGSYTVQVTSQKVEKECLGKEVTVFLSGAKSDLFKFKMAHNLKFTKEVTLKISEKKELIYE